MKIYPDEFKAEIAKKHLMPGSKSVAVLSKEIGVSEQSIRNWIYKFNSGIMSAGFEINTSKASYTEKLNLIFESKTKSEEEIGIWLREKGLITEHIKLWEDELKEKLNDKDNKL